MIEYTLIYKDWSAPLGTALFPAPPHIGEEVVYENKAIYIIENIRHAVSADPNIDLKGYLILDYAY